MSVDASVYRSHLLAGLVAVALLAAYRLAPHPWNVAPVGAMFALGGFYLGGGWRGFALAAAASLASDALLYWRWDHSLFHAERLVDYAAFLVIYLLARACASGPLRRRLLAAAASPLVFFLISNLGVFALGRLYPHTPAGLEACYLAALPFLKGTLAGDLIFIGAGVALVEGPRLYAARGPSLKTA